MRTNTHTHAVKQGSSPRVLNSICVERIGTIACAGVPSASLGPFVNLATAVFAPNLEAFSLKICDFVPQSECTVPMFIVTFIFCKSSVSLSREHCFLFSSPSISSHFNLVS